MFALVLAGAATRLWSHEAQRRTVRALLLAGTLLIALDGARGVAALQQAAANATPYHTFMARVRAIVPRHARVLALHQYWLGLAENDFRSYTDVVFLTDRLYTQKPRALNEVLEQVRPDVFLLDPILSDVLGQGEDSEATASEMAGQYRAYMERHQARELGRVSDATYGTLIVYALSP